MQFVSADSDFGAESKFASVAEAGGGIPEHTGGVDFQLELLRGLFVIGHDGVGVMRAIVIDMRNGGIEIVDNLHREDVVEIFGGPIRFINGNDRIEAGQFLELFVTTQFDIFRREILSNPRSKFSGDVAMDQQSFERVAN